MRRCRLGRPGRIRREGILDTTRGRELVNSGIGAIFGIFATGLVDVVVRCLLVDILFAIRQVASGYFCTISRLFS